MGKKGKPARRRGKEAAANDDTNEPENFLIAKAGEDVEDAKKRHVGSAVDDSLEATKKIVKLLSAAKVVESESVACDVLNEVADLAESVRDGCRRGVRNAKTETRNLQPSA